MSAVIAMVAGTLIGWIASLYMRTATNAGILTDILMGLVGGILGPLLIATGTVLDTFLAAVLGAAALVFLTGFVRSVIRRRDRRALS